MGLGLFFLDIFVMQAAPWVIKVFRFKSSHSWCRLACFTAARFGLGDTRLAAQV